MSPSAIDFNALQDSISKGIISGTTGLVSTLTAESNKRHDLRGVVDQTNQKVYELDREVVLLKGMMTSLIGTGDGSSGMVPRLEKDMSALSKDMTQVKSTVDALQSDMTEVKSNVKALVDSQGTTQSWMDGWRGVGIFLSIMGTCVAIVGGIVAGLFWLFQHGSIPIHAAGMN